MLSRSAEFDSGIANSHKVKSEVVVLEAGTGEELGELNIRGGQITLDGTGATRAAITLDVEPDPELVPMDGTDTLAPFGNTMRVSRGIIYPDGAEELLQVAEFRIDSASPSAGPGSP